MSKALSGAEKRKKKEIERQSIAKLPKITSILQYATPKSKSEQDPKVLSPTDPLQASKYPNEQCDQQIQSEGTLDPEQTSISNVTEESLSTDPGNWKKITESIINYWISKGPNACQNKNGPFAASKRDIGNQTRYFSEQFFLGSGANGETYSRE